MPSSAALGVHALETVYVNHAVESFQKRVVEETGRV